MTDSTTEAHSTQGEAPASSDEVQVARLLRVRIERDRAIFDVAIDQSAPARTSLALAVRATQLRPTLPQHTCVNSQSRAGQAQPLFGAVMDDTPLPHLLEHLAIDLLAEEAGALEGDAGDAGGPGRASGREGGSVACASGGSPTFVGTSEWLDRAARTARIQLSCPDDLLVLSAFAKALHVLNRVVLG